MRVLGLIPARGGSRRVPRKNLAVLGGRTLVRRALETALTASCFGCVALSSEDDDILAEAAGLNALRILRPAALAADGALAYDVAIHALTVLEHERPRFDALAIVQCTSPFTAPEDLAGALELLDRTGAESVVSVVRLEAAQHPLKLKVLEGDRLLPYLEDDRMAPSHQLPPVWVRNGSIYASRRGVLERGLLIGDDVRGFVMPAERSLDIDTEKDLAVAEFLLSRQL
jgi:CMP-N,N'-diacetyllegionaminic acid synthase